MRPSSRRIWSASFAIALAVGTVTVPTAFAAPDNSNVVINEVYGGGGNKGATLTHDFVELYNPTDAPIDLTGWTVTQRSKTDTGNGSATLSGTIPAKGYFLVQGAKGDGGTDPLPTPDATGNGLTFSGSEAIARLIDANGTVVDLVGWGAATVSEGSPAGKTKNTESVQRKEVGVDTDNNANDFEVAAPTPRNTKSAAEEPGTDPNKPTDPVDPPVDPVDPNPPASDITPIATIQGTGDTSPLVDQNVTTEGVVTAVYDEGGKKGFFLQTAGTGGAPKKVGDASDGIFVYMGNRTDYPQRGASVQVKGKVSEYFTQTQITASEIKPIDALETPKAIKIDVLPAGNEAREPYEGMLVVPKGPYTVTNNYTLNNTGDLGLAPGKIAHRTPTDVVAPGAPANELQAKQDAEVVYLDDGRTANYFRTDKNTPLPYIVTSDQGVKSIRTGDQVTFQTDVVVDYSFDQWRFQPLQPITGKNAAEDLPITWEDSRKTSYDTPDTVQGDYSIGFFNVLNYFSSLGEKESGCKPYNDVYGQPVGANNCKVRGAYSQDAFKDQQAKIVTAINKLDADVLGLSEIENTYRVTGDVAKRDEALASLVTALNNAGGNWDYVKSPQKLGTDEDFIRVAFIYQPDKVKPVGESVIFDDPAFTRTARQPLAQEFDTIGNDEDKNFVAVVNHFKSKGSVANGDADTGDGQGNNARVRVAQSQALLDQLEKQGKWTDLPTFLVGDFNAYTKEDAISTLIGGGFSIVEPKRDFDQASYQFGGQLGTLDHVLANQAAKALVTDAAVWNINGDESVAFEYSRRKYNTQDFFGDGSDPLYGYGNPFRSSDHDPVKVGFGKKLEAQITDTQEPVAGDAVTVSEGDELPSAESAVKDADKLPEGTKFEWIAPKDTNTVGDNQQGQVKVTYSDGSTDFVDVVVNVKPKAKYIVKAEINGKGELVVTYDNGQTENLGKVTGEQGPKGDKGDTGATGPKGDKGDAGATGPKGDKGDTGAAGKDGAQGEQGPKGDTGATGPKGDKGDTGAAGKDGKDGATGPKGDKGDAGAAGKDGKDGAQGPKGDKGDTGATGPKGDNGDTGAAGKDGAQGKQGPKGDKGDKGDTGAAGKDGAQGKQGPKGDKGDTGAAGKDGRSVKAFEINDEGNLIVTYSDGETADLGKVTGDAGTGEAGQDGKAGADGKDGKDGRGIANLEVNNEGELIATYTDGETQNLGRVAGADGAAGKDGKDGANAPAPAPANEGSSVSDRCLPALGIMTLPLLALVPLGLAATMDIPALAPVKEQLNNVGAQLPISPEMQMMAGGVAGTALAVAAIATLAVVCSTEGGSSE